MKGTKMIKHVVPLFVAFCILSANAETLRLPCRYTRTTYTVHTLTGITSNERTRAKTVPANIELSKRAAGDKMLLVFTPKRRGGGHDVSSSSSSTMDYGKVPDLITALDSVPQLGRDAFQLREEAAIQEIFRDGDIKLVFIPTNRGRNWECELQVGSYSYVIGQRHLSKVKQILAKF